MIHVFTWPTMYHAKLHKLVFTTLFERLGLKVLERTVKHTWPHITSPCSLGSFSAHSVTVTWHLPGTSRVTFNQEPRSAYQATLLSRGMENPYAFVCVFI